MSRHKYAGKYLDKIKFPNNFKIKPGVNIFADAHEAEGYWLLTVFGSFNDGPFKQYVFEWDGPGTTAELYTIRKVTNARGTLAYGGSFVWLFSMEEIDKDTTEVWYQDIALADE